MDSGYPRADSSSNGYRTASYPYYDQSQAQQPRAQASVEAEYRYDAATDSYYRADEPPPGQATNGWHSQSHQNYPQQRSPVPSPPPIPPNPYLEQSRMVHSPSPPRPSVPTTTYSNHTPQYPSYLASRAPASPEQQWTTNQSQSAPPNRRPSAFEPTRPVYPARDSSSSSSQGHRESMASGIISMYGDEAPSSPVSYSSYSSSYPRPPPELPSLNVRQGSEPPRTYSPSQPAYPSPSAISSASSSSYSSPLQTSNPSWDSARQEQARPKHYESTGNIRDRARPSFSSTSSRPTPADGFYSHTPALPERKQSLERTQVPIREGSNGDWRAQVEAQSIYEGRATPSTSSSFSRALPSRQPTIVTTPPIGHNGHRAGSFSSQSSGFTSSHPTFSSTNSGTVRRPSTTLSPNTSYTASFGLQRRPTGESGDDYDPEAEYLNPAFLSNIAVFVKDQVPRGMRVKGAVEHPQSFTGDEVVNTIQRALSYAPACDRKYALSVARSLHESLWFHEVDWSGALLKDGPGKVYSFQQDDQQSANDSDPFEIPTGILTGATDCYSPFCGKLTEDGYSSSCYAYSCPNRLRNQLERHGSTLSLHSAVEPVEESEHWQTSVPSSVLDALSKTEIQYQNLVYELIQGEVKYLQDLDFIEKGFAEPLRHANPAIIAPSRLDDFLANVLLNIAEIREHSRTFLDALQARQKESYVFRGIGQLIFTAAVEWGPAYTAYTVNFPLADYLFKEEKARNPRFNDLLMDFQKRPEAQKRGFDTFHNRATFRGLRYDLLLAQIYKCASEDDPDREYVQHAMSVIKQQATDANEGIAATKSKVALQEYHRGLVPKTGDNLDLELLDDSRRFFTASKVYRRPDGAAFTEWSESHLILFDHYLVTTKTPRERDGRQKYQMSRRAVPLDLIQLKSSSFSEPPVARSSGFHLRSAKFTGAERHPSNSSQPSASFPQDSSLVYPIFFYQNGRFNGLVYYYVESQAARQEWEKRLKEAIALRAERQAANQVVRLDPLADETFGTASIVGSLAPDAPVGSQFGRPTCSVPLTTSDGQSLVVAGCSEGLFIGFRGRPRSMRQVVHLSGITQCAVLPDHGFVLVVANRVLIAYSLEALIPSGTKLDPSLKAPQRLSGQKDVSFFRVGRVGDTDPRTLVIYAKKSGVKESVFKALEPVGQADKTKGGAGHRFLNFGKTSPDWFRAHKEFFMPTLVTSIQFHRSKLALIGPRGVEIMDLDSMRTASVPSFPSSRHDRTFVSLAKRCEEASTLGLFRLQESKFLLVYDEFAFHVGRHGEPIEGPVMEWESKPEAVAYCAPFIFLFSPTLIEIRDAFSGRLVQFITGTQIGLTFDGAGLSSSVMEVRSPRPGPREGDADKRIHFSMREGTYHVLYELVPLFHA